MSHHRPSGQAAQVDVLVVTVLADEYDAVLRVEEGALPGSHWEEQLTPQALKVAFRSFQTREGGTLRIAVTQVPAMGVTATATAVSPLVHLYQPTCLAMCGICAGRRGAVELGDVIIASRVWTYDTGKVIAGRDDSGQRVERLEGEVLSYNLPASWLQQAASFRPPPDSPWLAERPRTRMSTGPQSIEKQPVSHPGALPEPRPFEVHVGALGTGSKVVRDPEIFTRLAERERTLLGLEMEASAIGYIAYLHQVPYMVVMKGVTDFADAEKDDLFRTFASRASAECLLAFVRAHVPPLQAPRGAPEASMPDLDDVLEPGTSRPPLHPSPSALLNARHRFVPFFEPGRAALLQELRAWCDDQEPVSAWLLHGVGGIGKTRLLIEWCERLRQEGWKAGFLVRAADRSRFELLVASAHDSLVVIDYAESHPELGALLRLVARRRNAGRGGRLRLVLLARGLGDWWQELLGSEGPVRDLLSDRAPTELSPLRDVGPERHTLFQEALQRFAALRGHAPPQGPRPALEDPRFERVLYVHMAALAAVEGLSFTAESLMQEILDHEERFWLVRVQPTLRTDGEWRLFKDKARQAVTALTLRGGAPGPMEAEALLSRLGGARDDSLLLLLHDLYPGDREPADSLYVKGLAPDLLGEAMVLRVLRKQGSAAGRFLDRIFEDAEERALRTGFVVLGHLSADHPHETGHWIAHLLETHVEHHAVVALEAAKAVGFRTAHASLGVQLAAVLERKGTLPLALKLEAAGLPAQTVVLREVGLWVAKTLLRHLREAGEPEILTERIRLLNKLSERQGDLGMREQALSSAESAVKHSRALVEAHPGMHDQYLAGSLLNLGKQYGDLGKLEQALALSQEGLERYRQLTDARPDDFLPKLATSLNNQGNWQLALGRREQALSSLQEAVALRRELARARPGEFRADLATSLSNLSVAHRRLGSREEALALALEATAHYRQLAEAHPDAFLPDLAGCLINLSGWQSDLRRYEEALSSIKEAVEIFRGLARARPDAFRQGLATSLANLATIQSQLERPEALASALESVKHFRELAKVHPDAFLPDLATGLSNLGTLQAEWGLRTEALASAREAVEHCRELARARPDAYLAKLATSLNNLGVRQGHLGMKQEALASAREVVDIRRELARARPDVFLSALAIGLTNLGRAQAALGMMEQALASALESVEHCRELARAQPDVFRPELASSLSNLGNWQCKLGQGKQGLASIREAVEHYRELTRAHPDTFLHELATNLSNLGGWQSTLDMRKDALAVIQEAVELRRKLARTRPKAFLPELALVLNNLGEVQGRLGLIDEARASVQEALDTLWPFFVEHPRAFATNTHRLLFHLRDRLRESGQPIPDKLLAQFRFFEAQLTSLRPNTQR